ncbi:MAG TPA: hypothetical protein VF511_11030 [Chthoniobacterales bacterium]
MKLRLLTLAAIGSAPLLLTVDAQAMPLSSAGPASAAPATQVRMVCNEWGRCWDRDEDRGSYRRDWDDQRYRRWNRDRQYRNWDEDDDED